MGKLCAELDEKGYRYAEIRFAPSLHTKKGLKQHDAVAAACRGLGDKYRLILCCMRGGKNNEETLNTAYDFINKGVVALDLAGAEALYPTREYKHLFQSAAKKGIPYTIHAGEADGPVSVRDAIDMGAKRIGHGVRAIEDSYLPHMLAKAGIPLEICPTSNINTRTFKSLTEIPIKEYIKAGVTVTVNSDNMSVSNTDVIKELKLTEDAFGIDEQYFLDNAAKAAFIKL